MPLCLKILVVSYTLDDCKNIDVKDFGQIVDPVPLIKRTTWQFKVVLFVLSMTPYKSLKVVNLC